MFEDLKVQDAKWIATWLGRLSDEQIKDAFRAANYKPEEVEALAGEVRDRINALTKLSATATVD
ncbi:MAG: hypothetical protein ACR2H4_09365 [Pyrinomonadaceae bacterium]